MPAQLPAPFPTPDRDDLRDRGRRDFRFYSDGAYSTDEGGDPFITASVIADQHVLAYAQIRQSADNLVLSASTGQAAEDWATSNGLPGRTPASSASGYVVIGASAGGTKIFAGDEAKTSTGVRYRCLATAVYQSGQPVPIQGIDTGPQTNLPPGSALTWTSPRPGCQTDCVVWADPNGRGLVGGRLEETDNEIHDRVREAKRNPPAAGNDAQIQALVKAAGVALGIPVQQCFTYPAALGPGTTSIVFTVSPDAPGGSRLPSSAQVNAIEAWIKEQLPGDDSLFFATLTSSPLDLALSVQWRQGATAWADIVPWPPFYAGSSALVVTNVTSPLVFRLGRTAGGYGGVPDPVAGQTIAVFDPVAKLFRPKRIASFTKEFGSPPWHLSIDTTNNDSDISYTPIVGQRVCPWSESLNLIVPPLLAELDGYGPGEQVSTFFDAGVRRRRSPPPQSEWPNRLGARVINGVQDLVAVNDAQLLDPAPSSLPQPTPTGAVGTLAYLLALRYLAAFPL